jgi:ribosome-interacting GTPase 1
MTWMTNVSPQMIQSWVSMRSRGWAKVEVYRSADAVLIVVELSGGPSRLLKSAPS